MKYLLSLFILLVTLPTSLLAQLSETEALFEKFKSAARFDYRYPREKVYLHFDNSAYLLGDTIWYKAYVVRASSLKPTALSRVLYVELLNADGQQVEKQTLKLDSLGMASGAFFLNSPVHAGYHEVRAFTREMVNWGGEACFSRVLPIFDSADPMNREKRSLETDLSQLSIPYPERNEEVTLGRPRPYAMKGSKERLLDFYPEGGGRVRGVEQRIAFKLTDGKGYPVEDTVQVFDDEGKLCATAVAIHEGMGEFLLPAYVERGYAQVVSGGTALGVRAGNRRFPLPEISASYALTAQCETDGLFVRVTANDSIAAARNLLGMAVFNRENVCYFDTLTVGSEPIELFVPQRALRGGVNRLELFDASGRGLATRFIWAPLNQQDSLRRVHVAVSRNQPSYAAFSPAVVKVKTTDAYGRPVPNAALSIAVRDEAGNILATRDGGIEATLLLASELKGYIHRPDLYFESQDAAHRRMLDLLLQVQGWRANSFDVMCGTDTFDLIQPIEDKLILRGTVYKDNDSRKPYPYVNLNLRAYRFENDSIKPEAIEGAMQTDAEGRFAFESQVDFEGEYLAQFTMRTGEKDKRTWSRLAVDRWFEPRLRPFFAPELNLSPYDGTENPWNRVTSSSQSTDDGLFEWKDTLPDFKLSVLGTAEVKAKVKKYKGFTGNKYSWGGGEANGISRTSRYYNIEKELEHFKDLGYGGKMDFFEMLGILNSRVEYDRYNLLDDSRLIEQLQHEEAKEQQADAHSQLNQDRNTSSSEAEEEQPVEFKGRALTIYLNNRKVTSQELQEYKDMGLLDCDNIRSAAFVEDNQQQDALTGERKRTSVANYSLYIYEKPKAWLTRNKKGREYRHISGFMPRVHFYSPNYRQFDLPSASDIRRTLHWTPNAFTDENGEYHLIFFTNAREQQTLDISVRGLTRNGEWLEWN